MAIHTNIKLFRGGEPIMNKPLISVVMSVYNDESYLAYALESIIDQTFKDWELVIINDGSTDNTEKIIYSYMKKTTKIRLINNESNIGLSASLNKGILASRSDIILRVDSDDVNLPDRFSRQFDYLRRNIDIDVVGSSAYLINDKGESIGLVNVPTLHNEIVSLSFFHTFFLHPSVAIRRSFFDRVGLYDDTFRRGQDKELWMRGRDLGSHYANIEEPLIKYRQQRSKMSFKNIYLEVKTMSRLGIQHKVNYWPFYVLLVLIRLSLIKLRFYRPNSTKGNN